MYLLLCAMKEEVAEIINRAGATEKREIYGTTFYRGKIGEQDVVTGMTGVGKVMAAVMTQKLIDEYSPEGIVFSGIAGAINPGLEIGDIVLSKELLQHDMDATSLGFRPGEIPYTGIRLLSGDQKLLSAAKSFETGNVRMIEGRVLTGDQFVTSSEKKKNLREKLEGDAVEMEGAAAAFAAYMNRVPFLAVRIISDKADGNAVSDFHGFLESSSETLADMVCHIIHKLH